MAAVTSAIASAGLFGYSAIKQSEAAEKQGAYQRAMSEQNARFAEMNAEDSIKRGDKESQALLKQSKQVIGSQRAALASQGIEISSGSAIEIQKDTAAMAAEDATKIKNNAWREAWGFKTEAAMTREQGRMAERAGQQEARMSLLTGGAQVASSAGQGYRNWKAK